MVLSFPRYLLAYFNCNIKFSLFLHDVVTVVVDFHASTAVFLRNGDRTAHAKRAHVKSMRALSAGIEIYVIPQLGRSYWEEKYWLVPKPHAKGGTQFSQIPVSLF